MATTTRARVGDGATPPAVTTAVIGAGPAGLLFAATARLMFGRQGGDPATWPILLFDKRSSYERTHRLRIDPRPYRALAGALADPRFDEVLGFLDGCGFSPAANQLEERLAALTSALGIPRSLLHIGTGDGEVPLAGLRTHLEGCGALDPATTLTVVGADSVHSAVRDAVRGAQPLVEHTHQTVARLRVVGDGLPERLGRLDQYRISKVLGSVVDYRRNPNGFAEVDVFLGPAAHADLGALGATPAQPVALDDDRLAALHAPLLERLVQHLRDGMTASSCEVLLQSTFRLEHRYIERVAHTVGEDRTRVFLVGDASTSLPFFRGMACMGACVHELALAHCDLVHLVAGGATDEQLAAPGARYQHAVEEIRRREIAMVRARARLVRGAREFARVSSLLPFPLQSWFLSIPDRRDRRGGGTAGVVLNALVAVVAAAMALAGPVLSTQVVSGFAVVWWAALVVEAVGGVVYRAAQEFEPASDTWLRRVWRAQIAATAVLGAAGTVVLSLRAGALTAPMAAVSWFVLGAAFVVGIVTYDALGRRWFARADLGEDEP